MKKLLAMLCTMAIALSGCKSSVSVREAPTVTPESSTEVVEESTAVVEESTGYSEEQIKQMIKDFYPSEEFMQLAVTSYKVADGNATKLMEISVSASESGNRIKLGSAAAQSTIYTDADDNIYISISSAELTEEYVSSLAEEDRKSIMSADGEYWAIAKGKLEDETTSDSVTSTAESASTAPLQSFDETTLFAIIGQETLGAQTVVTIATFDDFNREVHTLLFIENDCLVSMLQEQSDAQNGTLYVMVTTDVPYADIPAEFDNIEASSEDELQEAIMAALMGPIFGAMGGSEDFVPAGEWAVNQGGLTPEDVQAYSALLQSTVNVLGEANTSASTEVSMESSTGVSMESNTEQSDQSIEVFSAE